MGRKYSARVSRGLDGVLSRANKTSPLIWDLEDLRVVIFSDLHRGRLNGADDFRSCKATYHKALGYYLEQGYTLVVLGDADEMWECKPTRVLESYSGSFELESEFHRDSGRYLKIFGNHDDYWARESAVARRLHEWFPGLVVPEYVIVSLRKSHKEIGRLLLLHGHQGTTCSDRMRWVGRYTVRYVVCPFQRITGYRPFKTPSRDNSLKKKHDLAMFEWASRHQGLVLVAGHTHRPVFESRTLSSILTNQVGLLRAELKSLDPGSVEEKTTKEELAAARAELEWVRAKEDGRTFDSVLRGKPCYFNTGSCSFADGDITGLELADGKIRLVRWSTNHHRPSDRFLANAEASLEAVMRECSRS